MRYRLARSNQHRVHLPLFLAAALVWASGMSIADDDRGLVVVPDSRQGPLQYDISRHHAIVIGIDEYPFMRDLRCAAADATAFAETLKTHYGYRNVTLLLDSQATRAGILAAFREAAELTDEDSLIIYYAGHGFLDDYGNDYWVPHDARGDEKFDCISINEVFGDWFRRYKVRHLLVIADSCFGGALLACRGGRQTDLPSNLVSMYRRPSRIALTSGGLEPVPDGVGQHSPFATRLLQFMRAGDSVWYSVWGLAEYIRETAGGKVICEPLALDEHMPGGAYVFCRRSPGGGSSPAPVPVVEESSIPHDLVPVDVQPPSYAKHSQKRQRAAAAALGLPVAARTRSVGIQLKLIPAGTCMMGASETRVDIEKNGGDGILCGGERPKRRVEHPRPFYIGAYEITQAQWLRVMQTNPSQMLLSGTNAPVDSVNWAACVEFASRLCAIEGVPSDGYRLPTEAEWEYACRADSETPFHIGSSLGHGDANFNSITPYGGEKSATWRGKTLPVGTFSPNDWGLFDGHGNVAEWCSDWYGEYDASTTVSPTGPTAGAYRVFRGGGFFQDGWQCRSAYRGRARPEHSSVFIGLRLVRSLADD